MRTTISLALALALAVITTGCKYEENLGYSLNGTAGHHWSHSAGWWNDDRATAVALHPSGDVILLGTVSGNARLGETVLEMPQGTTHGALLARIDHDQGTVAWARVLPASLSALAVAPDGSIVVGGARPNEDGAPLMIDGHSVASGSAVLLGLTGEGATTWASGIPDTWITALAVTPSGDLYAGGLWQEVAGPGVSVDAGPGSTTSVNHGFVARLSATGELVWRKDIATEANDLVEAIAADADGVVVTGAFGASEFIAPPLVIDGNALDNRGRGDAYVVRLDPDGSWRWGTSFGGPDGDLGTDIAIAGDGSVYVVGNVRGEVALPLGGASIEGSNGAGVLLALAGDGAPRWQRVMDGPLGTEIATVTCNADHVLVAGTADQGSVRVEDLELEASLNDLFVIRFGHDGGPDWGRVFTGDEEGGHERARDIAVASNGRLAIAGSFMGLNGKGRLSLGGAPLEGAGDFDLFVGLIEPHE
jgi:hypothetical protein